jgi:peptidoglycan/LPS O-acetylase OafA/YrhL
MTLEISKKNTSLLKGVGILLVVFHNFFHWVKPSCGENEFSFAKQNFDNFISNINFINALSYLFSYFGHYGVQIFIFLSGYGLTVRYGSKTIRYKSFIKRRLLKIYPTFTIAIIILLIYQNILLDFEYSVRTLASVFIRYTLIANWIPGKIFTLSGPFWFYSMIIQLYFIFPLFVKLHRKNKYALNAFLLISLLFTICTNPFFSSIDLSLYYNFLGNVPVFILGMIFAFNKNLILNKWSTLLFGALFTFGQFYEFSWYFSQISFVMITLHLILKFNLNFKKSFVSKFLILSGHLSMYIFAINGFMRKPWIDFANTATIKTDIYIYALIHIILVYVLAYLIKHMEKKTVTWVARRRLFSVKNFLR